MARKFHNLSGWLRDVRAALLEGDQLAFELAEVMCDVDELLDTDLGASPADAGEDHLLDADGGEGDGPSARVPQRELEDVQPALSGLVRVADGRQRRTDSVLAAPRGAGSGRPDGRSALLTSPASQRAAVPSGKVRRG